MLKPAAATSLLLAAVAVPAAGLLRNDAALVKRILALAPARR